jgi:hypothetical protein
MSKFRQNLRICGFIEKNTRRKRLCFCSGWGLYTFIDFYRNLSVFFRKFVFFLKFIGFLRFLMFSDSLSKCKLLQFGKIKYFKKTVPKRTSKVILIKRFEFNRNMQLNQNDEEVTNSNNHRKTTQ